MRRTAAMIMLAFMAAACSASRPSSTLPGGIEVQGEGQTPVSYGLFSTRLVASAEAGTVPGARAEAARLMQSMLDAARAGGVVQSDIAKWYPNLYFAAPGRYQASESYHITIKDFDRVVEIMTAVAAAGEGRGSWGVISLQPVDLEAARAAAGKAAIVDARLRAKVIADASRVRVGKVEYAKETLRPAPPRRYLSPPPAFDASGMQELAEWLAMNRSVPVRLLTLEVRFALA